LNTLNIHPSFF